MKSTACGNGHMSLYYFFRGSVSWFSLDDNWDFVSRGSITVTLREKIGFLKDSVSGLPLRSTVAN